MTADELLELIALGEDSFTQFKADILRADSLACEMVAFSNGMGGNILIGVSDDGVLSGLQAKDINRINQLISNAATEHVKPPITPTTKNFSFANGKVIVLSIQKGISKPYMDKNLHVYVKSGADKRKVTAREELQRMFQQSGLVHADELPIRHSSITDVDMDYFANFFEKEYGDSLDNQNLEPKILLQNMNLMVGDELNYAGGLLFAKKPQIRLPMFIIKAIAFYGNDITDESYIDSRDITGKLSDMFAEALSFCLINIHHIQNNQSVNSIGQPEIPRIVFEELISNALIHRDYFISSPIRLLIFKNRIEIISAGHLPNNLTIDNIKMGNSNIRNPILASFASRVLPYRGLGSGIVRALKSYGNIEFIDDRQNSLFKVIIHRIME
ncbi:MAG: putative DNA binding domain-containing protein [Moraxella sp.]|nr:putative DNA binding domain-containing protein [Moraxella sp.]